MRNLVFISLAIVLVLGSIMVVIAPQSTRADSLPETEINQIIPATIDFDPDTLNLGSNGKWVTVYIELLTGYDVEEIDVSTVRFNGIVCAESKPTDIGDYDKDGVPDLMVKFDRSEVQSILTPGEQVEVTIAGEVNSITFEGRDIIRVIGKQHFQDISGIWYLYMTSQGGEESEPYCFYIHQIGSYIYYLLWNYEYSISVHGSLYGNNLNILGQGLYYGEAINFSASATVYPNKIKGTYSYMGYTNDSGLWIAKRCECKQEKPLIRTIHIQDQGYGLDFYVWDLIPEGVTITTASVTGPYIGTIDLYSEGPTEYYPWYGGAFLGETIPTPGDVYTFSLSYSDGTSQTTTASVRDTLVDFPMPISPANGEILDTPTPTFSWQPPLCGCQGYYRIWVIDSEGNDMWSVYLAKESTSVAYNFDGTGNPLSEGETYEWRLIAFDPSTTGGPDNNVWVISNFTIGTNTP
ncbi:MAG TPA: hypothetical protein VMX96_04595 [Dehalococcoidia bacterium]|nr:hypothetical protein [Dehalococcoidia bacterium]